MNARQLQYAVMLAQVRNFSQLAEQLHISQPALSKQIHSLEQELGVRLFDRSSTPLRVTPAGEAFLSDARELVLREEQLRQNMERFANGERGRLVIGISPFRSLYMMPPVIRQLQQLYPGLDIVLREESTEQLHQGAEEGLFDFAIMNLPVDETLLEVRPLGEEELVLAVPADMADGLKTQDADESGMALAELADCAELPFVAVGRKQILRQQFDRLCAEAGLQPRIGVEVVGLSTAWAMVCAGVGAAVLPLALAESGVRSGVKLFRLQRSLPTRQPVIVTRKGQPLSEYAQAAIGLLWAGKQEAQT